MSDDEFNFAPITDEEVEDARKAAARWYRSHWGATMPPSQCRGMAKEVVQLVERLKAAEKERDDLKEQLEAAFAMGTNTKEEFENNPCTICGAAPGVHCPHD